MPCVVLSSRTIFLSRITASGNIASLQKILFWCGAFTETLYEAMLNTYPRVGTLDPTNEVPYPLMWKKAYHDVPEASYQVDLMRSDPR